MPWYAVHTKSRHEYKANSGLAQKNFTTFLPETEVWSKRKDRKKKIFIPLFPGYLFVETLCWDNEKKLAILKTSGVVSILGKKENSEPIPVPDDKIERHSAPDRNKSGNFYHTISQSGRTGAHYRRTFCRIGRYRSKERFQKGAFCNYPRTFATLGCHEIGGISNQQTLIYLLHFSQKVA